MTDDDPREDAVRRAFDRLRSDAHQVDTMAALDEHDPQRRARWNPQLLLGAAAAILVVVAIVVGVTVWGGDDDGDDVVAGDDSADGAADGGTDGTGEDAASDDSSGEGIAAGLEGITWQLVSGTGPEGPLDVLADHPVTLAFDGGQVTGTAACNGYGGDVTLTDDTIRVGGLGQTEMACMPESVMELERTYLAALAAVEQVALDDGGLVLTGPSVELVFEAQEPVPTAELVGPSWLLDTIIQGETAGTVLGDPATLTFAADGTFGGSTGCRTFTGRYVISAGSLQVTDLAMEGDCSDELAGQDNHVVSVLEGTVGVEIDGRRLTLTAAGGDGLSYVASEDGGIPAAPASYSLDDVECYGTVVGDGSLGSFDQVQRIDSYATSDCRRAVFVLGEPPGFPDEAQFPYTVRPDGVVEVELPDDWTLGLDTEALLNTDNGVAAVALRPDGTPFLYVAHGPGEARVSYWPGAVVVDTRLAGDAPEPVTGEVVLPGPLPAGLVGLPYEVTGLARPFEATGSVSLRTAPAQGEPDGSGEPVEVTWSGFEVLGDAYVGSGYGYQTASIEAWGEFSFTIDGLDPGEYELLFEAFAPEESGSAGTYVRFTIVPAAVVLSGDGIQFVEPDTGSVTTLEFGTDEDTTTAALTTILGEPTVSSASPECPNGAIGSTTYGNGGLAVDFGEEGLLSWTLRPGSQLTTLAGIGLGSTRAELEAAYAVEVFDSTLGVEFLAGSLGGLLDGDGPDAVVTNLWGGQICAFR